MTNGKIRSADEALIRLQIEKFVTAFSSRNVDLMMSLYAPGLVSFDIIPPLQYAGTEVYRKVWEETFALFPGPIGIEIRGLVIRSDEALAFSYCFLRLYATMISGQQTDYWERLTCCFQKTGGQWLIVHEHVSLPADLKSGKAVMNLTP